MKERRLSQQTDQAQKKYIALEAADNAVDNAVEDDDEESMKVELKENGSMDAVLSCDADFDSPPYHVEDFYYKTGLNT